MQDDCWKYIKFIGKNWFKKWEELVVLNEDIIDYDDNKNLELFYIRNCEGGKYSHDKNSYKKPFNIKEKYGNIMQSIINLFKI